MEHWKKLFNPHYLGSYAFQPGEEMPVTIKEIRQEEITNPNEPDKPKEIQPVAHFVQQVKPLILNKTNSKIIAKLAGTPDYPQWPGVGIILYVQKVKAFGDIVDAVRVRPVPPFVCADCGGIITGYNGKSHAEIREHTKKTYHRQLCPECAKKAAALAATPKAPDPASAAQDPEPVTASAPDPATAPAHRRRRAATA